MVSILFDPRECEKWVFGFDSFTEPRFVDLQKGWEAAIAPANQLFMLGLMAWLVPHQASLISLSIVLVTFMGPFKAIANVNAGMWKFNQSPPRYKLQTRDFEFLFFWFSAFAGLADENGSTSYLFNYKLMYVFFNLIGCCIGLWKLSKFGLLPITQADWISWYSVPEVWIFTKFYLLVSIRRF